MREIFLTMKPDKGETLWIASASNDEGVIEYDSVSALVTRTPLDAMTALANELYEEVRRLQQAYDFEHPGTIGIAAELRLKCQDLGGHNYGSGVCIREGCNATDPSWYPRAGETDADGR